MITAGLPAQPSPALSELSDYGMQRLILATIARACLDARGYDRRKAPERADAITWLKSGEPVEWLTMAGRRITQKDIDGFIDDCA